MERKYKACSVCGMLKPNTKEFFHVHTVQMKVGGLKTNWRGLRPDCKVCRNKKKREYHLKNKERDNKKAREYYHKHKETWGRYRKNKEHERLKKYMDDLNKSLSGGQRG